MSNTIQAAREKFYVEVGARSQFTANSYSTGLRAFSAFIETRGVVDLTPVSRLRIEHAIAFVDSLLGNETLAPKSRDNYALAVSRFYRFLSREGLINLTSSDLERLKDKIKSVRSRSIRIPPTPTQEDVEKFIAAAEAMASDLDKDDQRAALRRLRDIAIIHCLRSSGMRIGELIGITRGALDYTNRRARVIGKGNAERWVYFDSIAWDAIQNYLRTRQDGAQARALADLPLFARHDFGAGDEIVPLQRARIEEIFRQVSDAAGIDNPIHPHSFRHYFATFVLDQTDDLASVQDMLGHKDPRTTRRYAKVKDAKIQQRHREAFDEQED